MIDLDNLEGARRTVVAGRWRSRFDDLCFAAPSPSSLEVDVFNAGFDCAPVRRLKSRFFAALSSVRKPSRRPRVRSMSDVTVPAAWNSRIIR